MEMMLEKDGTGGQQSREVLPFQNQVEVEESSRTESVENLRILDSNPDQTPHETARNLEAAKILSKSIDLAVFEGRPRVSAFPSISFEHKPNRLHRYKMTTNRRVKTNLCGWIACVIMAVLGSAAVGALIVYVQLVADW